MKTKTMYQPKDGQLLFEGKPTNIRVEDHYLFLDGSHLPNVPTDIMVFGEDINPTHVDIAEPRSLGVRLVRVQKL